MVEPIEQPELHAVDGVIDGVMVEPIQYQSSSQMTILKPKKTSTVSVRDPETVMNFSE